ncbi:MAG TPA: helix-turn-helix domain-containing protein [Acidobacteriaceae bacterium]|nr:helix-turn-helix domain-containing protein [Acidobacteriaceae bacterium]
MPRPSNISDAFAGGDRRRLERALRTASVARVYRRVAAVLAVAEGHAVAEVARQMHVDRTTVHRWVATYLTTHDAACFADEPRSGRPPSANVSARQLAAILRQDPRRFGYRATTWTVDLLACYCAEHLDCSISPRTLRRRVARAGLSVEAAPVLV